MSDQDKLNSDAEYQRRKVMTSEERSRIAIDRTARDLYQQHQKDGKRSTFEDCERHVKRVVEKNERKKSDNGRD